MIHVTSNALPLGGIILKNLTLVTGPDFVERASDLGAVLLSLAEGRLRDPVIRAAAVDHSRPHTTYRVPATYGPPLPVRVEQVDVPQDLPPDEEQRESLLLLSRLRSDPDASSILETLTGQADLGERGSLLDRFNVSLALAAAAALRSPDPSVLVIPDVMFGMRDVGDAFPRVLSFLCGVAGGPVTVVAGMLHASFAEAAITRGDLDREDLQVWEGKKEG